MTKLDHEAAIKDVIARETEAFVARDYDGWAALWVQDQRTREVCISSSQGSQVLEGWDAISTYMRSVFESGNVCQITDFKRSNWNMIHSGDIVHVVFDGLSTHTDGRIEQTFETRVMERTNQNWRILYSSFVVRGHQRSDDNRLAVDRNGNVICAPDIAQNALNKSDHLTVSNGKLRAVKPAWDKVLQDGLTCAAQQHGYFEHYRYASQAGRNFRLPLVLGETDEGGVAVCVLFVRDGITFIEVDQEADQDARLNTARAIFGLSDGQMALAAQIVSGNGLTAAAQELEISVNTARTHLTRIYAKTGVNSQTALVRTLLSVG